MKEKIGVLIILFCFSCQGGDSGSVEFTVTTEELMEEKVKLEFTFVSQDSTQMILDWKALSYDCYYNEREDLLSDLKFDMPVIHDSIEYNQFLIENRAHKFRFFSERKFFCSSWEELLDVNCMLDWKTHYTLLPNQIQRTKSNPIKTKDLWVEKGDRKIRLHYLFNPTKEEKQKGVNRVVLSSNWFRLPEINDCE